jgi:hypothetical protein
MRSWFTQQTSIGSARALRKELEAAPNRLVHIGDRVFVSPVVIWLFLLAVFALVDLLVVVAALVAIAGGGDLFGPR